MGGGRVTCDKCKFWACTDPEHNGGSCQRYPPYPVVIALAEKSSIVNMNGRSESSKADVRFIHPATHGQSTCGEFQELNIQDRSEQEAMDR